MGKKSVLRLFGDRLMKYFRCPIDSTVMSEPVYLKPLLIQMETTAVKFADKSTLKFRCSIKFCNTRTSDCDAIIVIRFSFATFAYKTNIKPKHF